MSEAGVRARELLMSHPAAPVAERPALTYAEALSRATDPLVVSDTMSELARVTLMSLARMAAAREISREEALSDLFAEIDRLQEAFADVESADSRIG